MRIGILCIALLLQLPLKAQTYADSIAQFRRKYIEDLLADKRAPVKLPQVQYIDFYPADRAYCVWATFAETPGSSPFMVPTHSGKQKPFKEYGVLTFSVDKVLCTLHVYQSVDLVKNAVHKDDLFIMFNDETNYETTYAGGRYIDLTVNDIRDGGVWLDFNKCYNPYCAYTDGFSCPIPPDENRLRIAIKAGEKMFQH
ncbi:MAG: hypothetical protein K0Q79_760 [Flavipsychrobacter sp.]|jgi:uncharacterized protein (DUF1684 family)|nr:hypothetical protein [Flavipsychrobacter sp.]